MTKMFQVVLSLKKIIKIRKFMKKKEVKKMILYQIILKKYFILVVIIKRLDSRL
jgi:hypothetical protein